VIYFFTCGRGTHRSLSAEPTAEYTRLDGPLILNALYTQLNPYVSSHRTSPSFSRSANIENKFILLNAKANET